MYRENSIKLLAQHNYDFDLAKFQVMFPTRMINPDGRAEILRLANDDRDTLKQLVRQAQTDLLGYKDEEIEGVLQSFRLELDEKISPQKLEVYVKRLDKMQIKMPEDIEERLNQAEDFSKYLKSVLSTQVPVEKRKSLKELEGINLEAQSNKYCLNTPEMRQIVKHVAAARTWLEQAVEIKD